MNWINRTNQRVLRHARNRTKQRQFLGLLIAVPLVWFAVQWYQGERFCEILWYALPPAVAMLFPAIVFPLLYSWLWIGQILSEITSTLVLSVIYYGVMYPIRLLRKKEKNHGDWKDPEEMASFEDQF